MEAAGYRVSRSGAASDLAQAPAGAAVRQPVSGPQRTGRFSTVLCLLALGLTPVSRGRTARLVATPRNPDDFAVLLA